MKIKSLTIKNIGLITDETIEFNKPLILFYGEIRMGKTTYLNAIRWAFGGSFPADIIQHGKTEASIELKLENGNISRSFYINKDGETVSRPQTIIIDNKVCKVNDLKQFLNPFLLNQNFLVDKNDKDQQNYIIDLFNVDTSDIDSAIATKEKEASELRAKIKGYGEITLTEVEKPDFETLNSKHAKLEHKWNAEKANADETNRKAIEKYDSDKQKALQVIVDFNSDQDKKQQTIDSAKNMLNDIFLKVKGTIFEKCFDIDGARKTLETLPKPETKKLLIVDMPELILEDVDDAELKENERQIQEAKLQQVKYDSYLKDKSRFDAKEADQVSLKTLEGEIKSLRNSRLSKLCEINGKIEGLEANETGIIFEDTAFNMLSTSQLMTLSSKLSALYPEGFGLELIDRGESLGKSIFDFVKKAESEEKTILATIVGERPANVPENIGVFVVENGKLN